MKIFPLWRSSRSILIITSEQMNEKESISARETNEYYI